MTDPPFSECKSIKYPVCYATVTYVKDSLCPESYFNMHFLHGEDRIIEWKNGETDQYYKSAHVVIKLGQPKLPPKKKTNANWARKSQISLEAFEQKLERWVSQAPNEEIKAGMERIQAMFQPRLDEMKLALAEVAKSPNKQVSDNADMTCSIIFSKRYCHLCRTAEHTFAKCQNPNKGCKICASNSHSSFKCPKKFAVVHMLRTSKGHQNVLRGSSQIHQTHGRLLRVGRYCLSSFNPTMDASLEYL